MTSGNAPIAGLLAVQSLSPQAAAAHDRLFEAVMHGDSPLSHVERGLIAVTVSAINRCDYCVAHFTVALAEISADSRVLDALKTGDASALTDRERTLLGYAARLTREPGDVASADIEKMRDAGFDDAAIVSAAQTAAYATFANRLAQGLVIELPAEPESEGGAPS